MAYRIASFLLAAALLPLAGFGQERCDSLMANGYYRDGVTCLEQRFAKNERNMEAYDQLLEALLFTGDSSAAFRLVRKQERKYGNSRLAYLVDQYILGGALERKAPDWSELQGRVTSNPFSVRDAAERLEKYGQTEEAIALYLLAERQNPKVGTAFNRGQLHAQLGQYSEQYDAYITAVEVNRSYMSGVRARIAQNLSKDPDDQHNKAVKEVLYDRIARHPQVPLYEELLLWVLREEGSTERAFAYLKAKRSNDAPSLSSLFQLGREAHELKKYALSSEIYRYLLRQKAALRGYGLLGEVLLRTGENDLALGNDLEPLFEQYPLGGCEECFSWELWQVRQRLMRESAAARAGNETALDSLERRTDQLMKRYPYEFERGQCYHLRADGLLLFGYFDDALLDYARAETLLGDHELGDQSKFKRALCAFYSGDIPWSLTQLEVLMRSTSKTIANDAAEYALLIAANSVEDTAMEGLQLIIEPLLLEERGLLDSALAAFERLEKVLIVNEIYDDLLFKKGQLLLKMKRPEEAYAAFEPLVRMAGDGMWREQALWYAGKSAYEAAQRSFDPQWLDRAEGQLETYLLSFPAGLYTEEARQLYRTFAP